MRFEHPIESAHLPEQVNVLRWAAAQFRAAAQDRRLTRAQHDEAIEKADWLDYLGKNIPFKSKNPVYMIALGAMALDPQLRTAVRAFFDQVDRLTDEASGQQSPEPQPSSSPWAPVPKD